MTSDDSVRAARWLLAVVVFLIVYGSLFPFRFEAAGGEGLAELVAGLTWARTTRSDIAANVLLYLPFGACLGWMLAARLGGPLALVATTLAGTLLAASIEVAQVFETRRVASLADLVYNGTGALAGGALALALRSARRRVRRHVLHDVLAQPIAAALLLLWLGYRLAPFALSLDPGEWLASVGALRAGVRSWADPLAAVGYVIAWLVVAQALATLLPRRPPVRLLALVMSVVLAGTVLIAGRSLDPNEILAMLIALVLSLPLSRLQTHRAAALLAWAVAALIVVEGLVPFDFRLDPESFGLVPFEEPLMRYRSTNLLDLFRKCFLYGSLVWLLVRSGQRVRLATLAAAGLVLAIEFLQVWLPGKAAEITDPLMVLAAGGLLAIFEGDGHRPHAPRFGPRR